MGKKFVGLDGLKHFWKQAKIWIAGRITGEVTARIAEVVANAPEDLDTLKEIADWISAHADSASEMNTQINTNKNDIAALQTSVAGKADAGHTHDDRYYTESEINTKLSGKSDTGHTHTKSQITDFPTSLKNPNALTVNGKTYDGSSAVDAGVQTVANGGTGATNAADGFNTLADGVRDSSTPIDSEKMLLKPTGTWYKTTCLDFWNYIKGKISSVLGLTKDNYGGKASTAGTADKAIRLKTFASWNSPYEWDSTNGVRVNVYKITMTSVFNSILVQIYDDINHGRCRRYVLGLWHVQDYGCNVSVTDLGGTKASGLRVWMGTDGNVYLQANVYWTSAISFSYLDVQYDWTTISVTKIGVARYGYNKDINGTVLFTPLTDPIIDCGAIRADQNLSSAERIPIYLKADELSASNKLIIPIGAPSYLEDGCIWIER